MEIAYWIVAGLLSCVYLFAGGKKLVQSQEQLAPMMGWVDTVPMPQVRAIGAIELLGVVGLILPPLIDVAPWVAIVAAVGFAVLQVLATRLHLSRGETGDLWLNLVMIALAVAAAVLATTF
jgi:hypothetical protein